MPKGMFSQGTCLLSDGSTAIEHVRQALENHQLRVVKQVHGANKTWMGGDSLVVAYRPDVNGFVSIDVVNECWPDQMGDPKSEADLFGAWSMGFFGPFTYPGGLERAQQHCWWWQEARETVARHRSFLRLKVSYVLGAEPDSKLLPEDYRSTDELMFLNGVVQAVGTAPGIVCYFNPNGETLFPTQMFDEICTGAAAQNKLPLLLWSNVRHFGIDERYSLMDSVGNGQFDIPDVEAVIPNARFQAADVEKYLRNVSHYLLDLDREISAGESFDGPGDNELTWTVDATEDSLATPPRRTIRLCPKADQSQIVEVVAAARE